MNADRGNAITWRDHVRAAYRGLGEVAKTLPASAFVLGYLDSLSGRLDDLDLEQRIALADQAVQAELLEVEEALSAADKAQRGLLAEATRRFFTELARQNGEIEAVRADLARLRDEVCAAPHIRIAVGQDRPSQSPVVIGAVGSITYEAAPPAAAPPKEPSLGPRWPAAYILPGVRAPLDRFAGRRAELRQIVQAIAAGSRIVTVMGPAGQGKSTLISKWYENDGKALPAGIGLFWCSPYQGSATRSRYSFDDCLDDLILYLTGELVDRQATPLPDQRLRVVADALRLRPAIIVLDGAERWLRRWAADPDAGTDNVTATDVEPSEPAFGRFLQDAANWAQGSALLLLTRAIPKVLIGAEYARIGASGQEGELGALLPDDAVTLLRQWGVHGAEHDLRQAALAYGCHPFAVRLLGQTLAELYGADVTRWPDVDPSQGDLGVLLDKALSPWTHCRPLLNLVACSETSAPWRLLAELLAWDEKKTRYHLAALARWRFVDFAGDEARQHTFWRRHVVSRLSDAERTELGRRIVGWWATRPIPDRPTEIAHVMPRVRAVENALSAGLAEEGMSLLYAKPGDKADYHSLGEWLLRFGYLTEDDRLLSGVAKALERLMESGRGDLRNDLAMAYNNRGLARADLGRLPEAIEDYDKAVGIYGVLVGKQGRPELRNELAAAYDNRGIARADLGRLEEAIEDYDKAIGIREALVETEGRLELRNDLAMAYSNRGLARADLGWLEEAIEDYDKAVGIYGVLVGKQGRLDLRNDLAGAYSNRGNARAELGQLEEAIEDYDKAFAIREVLVEKERRLELRNDLAMAYSNRGIACRRLGQLEEAIGDYDKAVGMYRTLVEEEGRLDLRNDLAMAYNNRAIACRRLGRLEEAIEDYDKAVAVYDTLVEKEERRELRNDLARAYSNRGLARAGLGQHEEAIEDYDKAIGIREALVETDGRRELGADYESSLFNRAMAYAKLSRWDDVRRDLHRGVHVLRSLMGSGRRHLLPSFLQVVRARCAFLDELGDTEEAAGVANQALAWLVEELEAGRLTAPLCDAGQSFLEVVQAEQDGLLAAGLDQALLNRAIKLWAKLSPA